MSTEYLATYYAPDGKVWNVPTIWWDKEGNPTHFKTSEQAQKAAIKYEKETGKKFPRFETVDEAVAAAEARSAGGGATQEPLAKEQGTLQENGNFGYKVRDKLFPAEDKFFKANPEVAGMASESGHVILNPYSPEDVNKAAVVKNESARLYMRDKNLIPDFAITPEQRKAFAGTEYAKDDGALKQTIAARIFSGDPSAQATEEQQQWAEKNLQEDQVEIPKGAKPIQFLAPIKPPADLDQRSWSQIAANAVGKLTGKAIAPGQPDDFVSSMLLSRTVPAERYQLWPEKLVRGVLHGLWSGFTLAKDVQDGKVDLNSPEGIERVMDMAGLAVLGGKPFASLVGKGVKVVETEALDHYAASGYRMMNRAIDKLPDNQLGRSLTAFERLQAQPAIRLLDRVIDHAPPLTESAVVYRSMGNLNPGAAISAPQSQKFYQALQPGDVMQWKPFTSTTASPRYASEWSRRESAYFTIQLPKGSKALDVSAAKRDRGLPSFEEWEYLLPRDTKFQVIAREQVQGAPHLTLKALPEGSKKAVTDASLLERRAPSKAAGSRPKFDAGELPDRVRTLAKERRQAHKEMNKKIFNEDYAYPEPNGLGMDDVPF